MTTFRYLSVIIFCLASHFLFSQTKQEEARSKAREGIKLMDSGDLPGGIRLMEEAHALDPDNYDYSYEIAYGQYASNNPKQAIKVLEKIKKHKYVTDQCYQLLGNSYDISGNSEKAQKVYNEGLEKFPNSGLIYLEKGNVYWGRKEYLTALPLYEKGIQVSPGFSSNYYRATRIFLGSTEELWGMIYGEIFMNIERNSDRTAEISKMLYDTYKSQITFTPGANANETSASVSFSKSAYSMTVEQATNPNGFKLPYGMVYEGNLMMGIASETEINTESICRIRKAFLEKYFEGVMFEKYPNVLFDYQKKIMETGHLDAYNHWIIMKGDEEAFTKWQTDHTTEWTNFIKWFSENKLKLDQEHKFYREQY